MYTEKSIAIHGKIISMGASLIVRCQSDQFANITMKNCKWKIDELSRSRKQQLKLVSFKFVYRNIS